MLLLLGIRVVVVKQVFTMWEDLDMCITAVAWQQPLALLTDSESGQHMFSALQDGNFKAYSGTLCLHLYLFLEASNITMAQEHLFLIIWSHLLAGLRLCQCTNKLSNGTRLWKKQWDWEREGKTDTERGEGAGRKGYINLRPSLEESFLFFY